jgi:histone-lysine N-methyltransferase SETMAR
MMRSGFISSLDTHNQWYDPGQVVKPVAKRDMFSSKAMLCVWWNFEGIIHLQLMKNNRAINAELCSTQLDRMYLELSWKYPALVNRKRVLLQQDNASPHTARKTKEKLRELDAIALVPHPAYRPNLLPCDFYLFWAVAHFLHGWSFETIKDVKMGCHEFFVSKDKAWYCHGFKLLAERWFQTI